MKSVNFQRNKSMIRVVNEKTSVKKRRNWDRVMYLCLIGLFFVFGIYYLFSRHAYVHAYGHVIIENTHIRLTDDARIIELHVSEGDSIQKNDTLFSYAEDRDDERSPASWTGEHTGSLEMNTSDSWWTKEVYALRKKMLLNAITVSENKNLIDAYKGELKRLTNEVILDVLPKTRLDYVQNEITRLNSENKKLEAENTELKRLTDLPGADTEKKRLNVRKAYLKRDGVIRDDSEKLAFSEELLSEARYFKSPVNGIATRVFIHNYETALKSEDIMTIHQTHPAFIKAYFDQEDLRYFRVGDRFRIEFPDGTVSEGILRRFYIATYTLPDEFQKKYEPTTRSIAADIYPAEASEISKWRAFYKMSVDITKIKFN